MAGATISSLVAEGVLNMDKGDMKEILDSLMAAGDGHEWQKASDHGSGEQRVAYFNTGWKGGLDACLAS